MRVATGICTVALVLASGTVLAQARDPGVRSDAPGAGEALEGLSSAQTFYFNLGEDDFNEVEGVGDGLGPRFNLDSCGGCHSQPATGGTSPAVNPQVAVATKDGARNTLPSFIKANGPVREARFKQRSNGQRDGGVHALFVVSGKVDASGDASGCNVTQENFDAQLARNNVIFRIPTPTFGLGLVESIPDGVVAANISAQPGVKALLGISGRANHNGNDGTMSRFGWKAQNVSLMVFSGEAYNVEMGISNEMFMTEREENGQCQNATLPNDFSALDDPDNDFFGGVEKFAFFMRFLDQPKAVTALPNATAASISSGRQLFTNIGCGLCHTPTLTTGDSSIEAMKRKSVNLFSDLAIHNMGPRLADGIVQGEAQGDEFRTAPLWGLGQRIFFLHDGRTSDLVQAIQAHASAGDRQYGPSEANRVTGLFNALPDRAKQDVLNFLRSL